jgi:hypothetical protein
MQSSKFLLIFLSACSGKTEPTDTNPPVDTEVEDTAEEPGINVEPFTLEFTGALEDSLAFDTPSCTYQNSTHFRSFWRNGEGVHTFVLIAEILGGFEGVGHYDHETAGAHIKLQEEAGGDGNFFQSDTAQGDTFGIDIDLLDTDVGIGSGSFSFNVLHGDGGATSGTPLPVPIRCPSL